MMMPKPVLQSQFSHLVIFKIFIRIYMCWPPMAAFTTITPSWCAHHLIPVSPAAAGFPYEMLKILKAEGKITDVINENMMNWRHSGFHVYCGKAIWPHNEDGLENLARYIIRASFSQERMTYIAAGESANGVAKVIYESKDGKTSKTFDALDWLAQLIAHIPNRGEQMVRYYGFYSNKSRGLRKKASTDDVVPALIESEVSSKEFRKSWARLIQKIYPAAAGLIHWCVLSAWGL